MTRGTADVSVEGMAAAIARAVLGATSEAEARVVTERITGDPVGVDLLKELSGHPDPVVRAWVVDRSAKSTDPASRSGLLRKLARDRDSDVADVAIENLIDLGDRGDRAFVIAALVRNLRSASFGTNRFGLWSLARLRAREALPAIDDFRADSRNAWKEKAGGVAAAVIEGRDTDILAVLRGHDHERMQWLAIAAGLIGTDDARDALRQCATGAPDDQCRADCSIQLRRFE
jgi:hypothetical protein